MNRYLKLALYSLVAAHLSVSKADTSVDFFRAVNVDNAGAVKSILAAGFDPNQRGEKGQTALILALRDGSPKVVAVLLADARTAVDLPNASDETPLMMAALRGELAAVQQLLERGAKVNRSGWAPLHYAATGPEPKVVALLLDRGADIEAPSANGTTPLMMAARYGSEDALNLLLARGAKLSARNVQGLGPADFARLDGRERLAARLAATPP